MTHDRHIEPEEDWEASISAMLSGLGPVDPPDGFIASAINHRPLYAGRATLGLGSLALFTLALAVGMGGLRSTGVVPQVESLAEQHSLVAASFFSPFQGESLPTTDDGNPDDLIARLPKMKLPSGLEPKAFFEGADFQQALFSGSEAGNDAVSIFHQRGLVDFSKLPAEGLQMIEDVPAWVDTEQSITVLQAKDEAVTIVGLSPDEVADVVRSVPRPNLGDKLTEAINTITSHLGFPDLN